MDKRNIKANLLISERECPECQGIGNVLNLSQHQELGCMLCYGTKRVTVDEYCMYCRGPAKIAVNGKKTCSSFVCRDRAIKNAIVVGKGKSFGRGRGPWDWANDML